MLSLFHHDHVGPRWCRGRTHVGPHRGTPDLPSAEGILLLATPSSLIINIVSIIITEGLAGLRLTDFYPLQMDFDNIPPKFP